MLSLAARVPPAGVENATSFAGRHPMIVLRYLVEQLRETLPDDERTAGAFVAGMVYAFVLFWTMLVLVTWWWAVTR